MQIRLGVIGAGIYGTNLLRVFRQVQYEGLARLVAVADIDEDIVKQQQESFGIKGYIDYKEMLEKENLDAIGIATPDHLHREISLDVAEQGKHLFVEKPLDMTVQGCDEIINTASRNNILLQVDFHKRFDRPFMALRNEIQTGKLGKIQYGYVWMEDTIEVPYEWLPSWAPNSSPAWFLGTHYFDLLRWVFQCNVVKVYATGHKGKLIALGVDTFDSIQAKLEFENKATINIDVSWILPKSFGSMVNGGLRIIGTKGIWEIDGQNRGVEKCTEEKVGVQTPNYYMKLEEKDLYGHAVYTGFIIDSIKSFVKNVHLIKNGGRLQDLKGKYASGEDGREATRIASAIHESIEHDKIVTL